MAITRHGLVGWSARPAGSFAGKVSAGGKVTPTVRHGLTGWVTRSAGAFDKSPGANKVAPEVRHALVGWATRPAGSFDGKTPSAGGKVTPTLRHGFAGWVTQPAGSFGGKAAAPTGASSDDDEAYIRRTLLRRRIQALRQARIDDEAAKAEPAETLVAEPSRSPTKSAEAQPSVPTTAGRQPAKTRSRAEPERPEPSQRPRVAIDDTTLLGMTEDELTAVLLIVEQQPWVDWWAMKMTRERMT